MSEWDVMARALELAGLGDAVRLALEPRWPCDYEALTSEVQNITHPKCTYRVPALWGGPHTRFGYWHGATSPYNCPSIRRIGLQGTLGGAGNDTGRPVLSTCKSRRTPVFSYCEPRALLVPDGHG